MCVTTYRFSVDCHIFRLPRVTSRSSHVVVLTLTNSFTERLQRHNHRESNDHTMARRTSLQAILKPPTRHTHNKPRRIRHIRCKILLEGRKTIKWMLRKVAAMMAPLVEPFKLERNSPYNTVIDLFRLNPISSIICNFFLIRLCELKIRFNNNIIFCFKKIFEWNQIDTSSRGCHDGATDSSRVRWFR